MSAPYRDHQKDFQPFMLVNDIVRYWRILLLNYAAKIVEKERELAGEQRDADRRLRSYKLRFSRCMTCFSALARLLAVTGQGAVTKDQVKEIVKQRPAERLKAIAVQVPEAAVHVTALLDLYETFLRHSDERRDLLIAHFMDTAFKSARMREGQDFGNKMFDLLQELTGNGRGRELLRHMVV